MNPITALRANRRRIPKSLSTLSAAVTLVIAAAGLADRAAANEQIVLRSGQVNGSPGNPGELDDTITSKHVAVCNTPLSNAPFGSADFAAARTGPQAILCQPLPSWAWPPALPDDAAARWINWGSSANHGTTNPSSVLYAVPFQVTTAIVDTATVTLECYVDDTLGDPVSPNRAGVYLNGVPLGLGMVADGTFHSQACVPIQSGQNFLYIYQRDTGCSDAGVMFSCTIDVDTPGTCAQTSFCNGDGGTTDCPCGNSGQTGHGCENSSTTGGALLSRTGAASLSFDTIHFTCSGEKPTALSIVLQGSQAVAPTPYGDGLRCVGGLLKRLYVKSAVMGTIDAPGAGDLSVSAQSAAKGDTIVAGSTRYYQTYYRDPSATFCASPLGSTFNVSNGIALNWGL